MGLLLLNLKDELRRVADPERAKVSQRYFKTGKGEYAQGDIFLGVTVPNGRQLVKKYWRQISVVETQELLRSKIHEERLVALLILVAKFENGDEPLKKEIFELYLANTKSINNWDLVDMSAPRIVGNYLEKKDKGTLSQMARSENLWEKRIAMLATLYFTVKGDPGPALEIAGILIDDKQDLIQKAVGWMLREVGKRCGQDTEERFLQKYYKNMPRTALRYAIERFDPKKREYYLKKTA